MKQKNLDATDAHGYLVRDEDHFFDRKALRVSGRSVQKIAVAFANADGGEFVIGIADDEEEPVPENDGRERTKLKTLIRTCRR